MSERDDNQRNARLRVVCIHCDGDGYISVPRAAILAGSPQTVLTPKPCPYCTNGRQRGFHPPV